MGDEEPMVFDIPVNFAEEGTMLGGRVKSRNLLEAALVFVLFLQPILALQTGGRVKAYLAVLVVLPACIFSVTGILGESLSSFFMAVLYFYRTRRVWGRPDGKERLERGYRERKRADGEKKKIWKAGRWSKRTATEAVFRIPAGKRQEDKTAGKQASPYIKKSRGRERGRAERAGRGQVASLYDGIRTDAGKKSC